MLRISKCGLLGPSPAESKVNRITGKLHNRKPHHSEYERVTGADGNGTESGCLEGCGRTGGE